MPPRALVGATGCIGANVAAALLARGYDVRAMRRIASSLDALDGPDVSVHVGAKKLGFSYRKTSLAAESARKQYYSLVEHQKPGFWSTP